MSLENHPVLQTPNIDGIGREGVRFTRAYTTCASCIAARRSLLTGQFPSTNGVVGYKEGIPITTPTLPQLLHDRGYFTAIAGRYMHQSPREEPYGFEKCVLGSVFIRDDDYAKYLESNAPELGGIRGIGLSNNGRDAKPFPLDEELHATNWAVRQTRKILAEEASGRPMFLVSSYFAPHPPLCPPARYMDRFLKTALPSASVGGWAVPPPRESYENNVDANRVDLKGDEFRLTQAGYFGLIEQIDDLISELLSDFKAKSEKEGRPWVIVFTSDHGEMLGDHYLFRKCEPYEGSSRIPFLIQASPELGLAAGISCDRPVCLEDIMPTLLEFAGVEVPDNLDGVSLVPVLQGRQDKVRDVLHCEHATCYDAEQGYHFLTDGRMKYIWRPANGGEQLFNLEDDPRELRDLSRSEDLAGWRSMMIKELAGRPEGFSDGEKLIAGRRYGPVLQYSTAGKMA